MKSISLKSLCLTLAATLLMVSGARAEILVKDGDSIAFLGDSITDMGWNVPGGYARLVVDALSAAGIKVTPYPAGMGGNKSNDMLARLDKDVLSKNPTWMTLSCGVNDVWAGERGVKLEDYQKNITAIVEQAQARGVKVVLLTATPINEDQRDVYNVNQAPYNEFLRKLAKEKNLPFADLNADFQAYLQPLTVNRGSRYLTIDGVHMNPDGNLLMAKGVLRALGFSAGELARFENTLLDKPNGAAFPQDYRVMADPNLSITLGQFRALEKIAAAKKIPPVQLRLMLGLKAWNAVLDQYKGETVFDFEQARRAANAKLPEVIAEFIKTN